MSFKIETGNVEVDVLLPYKLSYKVYLPEGYNDPDTTYPLVLFLHGVGERGDDIDLVETHGLPKVIKNGKTFPFITVAPQCPNQEWWSRAEMVKCLVYLVTKITKMYNVDNTRVYVTGLSMGGFGTIALANERPDLFAAALAVCGGADFNNFNSLKNIPLWLLHGSDDEVHPAGYSEKIYSKLKDINPEVKLTIYDGVDHNSWDITYDNSDIYEWLLSKQKKV
jgi:predicted peptidase